MVRNGKFWGVIGRREIWIALGADSVDGAGTVQFYGSSAERNRCYVVELIERAKANLVELSPDDAILRRALQLYAEDRPARALSKLASAVGQLRVLEIAAPGVEAVAAKWLHSYSNRG